MSEPKILFIGAGAIGASVAAWVAESYKSVWIMGRGETQDALRIDGITTYEFAAPAETRRTVRIPTVTRPGEIGDIDIVVLAVKNYGLEAVAKQVREELGDWPIIVSLANGIDNQRILPKLFSKVIYGVVVYNARRDAPVVVGFQDKGPLLIGTLDNTLGAELELVSSILARGCPTEIVDRMQDAVHTKIVINLTNALDALVGQGWRPLSDFVAYQQLLSQTLWEGVRIVRAAGFREHRIPGLPSFALLGLVARLPGWLTRPLFRRRLRAMNMSSMTQDVALRGAHDTEIESITGYIVEPSTACRRRTTEPSTASAWNDSAPDSSRSLARKFSLRSKRSAQGKLTSRRQWTDLSGSPRSGAAAQEVDHVAHRQPGRRAGFAPVSVAGHVGGGDCGADRRARHPCRRDRGALHCAAQSRQHPAQRGHRRAVRQRAQDRREVRRRAAARREACSAGPWFAGSRPAAPTPTGRRSRRWSASGATSCNRSIPPTAARSISFFARPMRCRRSGTVRA